MPTYTATEPPHPPRPTARHLTRSHYDIWYFRWIVPAALRSRYPRLPRDVKRSSGTCNVRFAAQFARDMLGQCLSRLTLPEIQMPRSPDERLDATACQLV